MKTIWKFPVQIGDFFEIEMPKGAKILHFGIQYDGPQMWVLVDSEVAKEKRQFMLVGTGHDIHHIGAPLKYIGTVLMASDSLVWHLFEI